MSRTTTATKTAAAKPVTFDTTDIMERREFARKLTAREDLDDGDDDDADDIFSNLRR